MGDDAQTYTPVRGMIVCVNGTGDYVTTRLYRNAIARAESAESERDALRAAVERVRGCQRYELQVEYDSIARHPSEFGDWARADDLDEALGALGQGEGTP